MPISKKSDQAQAQSQSIPQTHGEEQDLVSVFFRAPASAQMRHDVYDNITDEAGNTKVSKVVKSWVIQGGTFAKVPRLIAEMWKRQSANTQNKVVDPDGVGAPPGHDPDRLAAAERKNADLEDRLKSMEELVRSLRESQAVEG